VDAAGDEQQGAQRPEVEPVGVVHDEQHGAVRREAPQQPVHPGAQRGRLVPRLLPARRVQLEQRRHRPALMVRQTGDERAEAAQELGQRREPDVGLVPATVRAQHPDPGTAGVPGRGVQQRRLADAGLAHDDEGRRHVGRRGGRELVDEPVEHLELGPPPDQGAHPGAGPAGNARARTAVSSRAARG
jgi:hypothetical protein